MKSGRVQELVNTTDKRLVSVFVALFVIAFALVKANTFRDALRGCAEAGHAVPVVPDVSPGPSVPSDSYVGIDTSLLCPAGGPKASELALSLGTKLPMMLFSAVALLMLCHFLWGAVRPGLHSPVSPGRLRRLGWVVLVAGPVCLALQYFFSYQLADTLIRNTPDGRAGTALGDFNGGGSAWLQEMQMNFPWWCVFAGVSALVVAKLLRVEVAMGEEIQGTI